MAPAIRVKGVGVVTPTNTAGASCAWYKIDAKPSGLSVEQRKTARQALGLDGGKAIRYIGRRQHGLAVSSFGTARTNLEPGVQRVAINPLREYREWADHYMFLSFIVIQPSPARNVGRVAGREPLDWGFASADNECPHGRLAGDPCPQPYLGPGIGGGWPYERPCWCCGEEGALTREEVSEEYGGHVRIDVSRAA